MLNMCNVLWNFYLTLQLVILSVRSIGMKATIVPRIMLIFVDTDPIVITNKTLYNNSERSRV